MRSIVALLCVRLASATVAGRDGDGDGKKSSQARLHFQRNSSDAPGIDKYVDDGNALSYLRIAAGAFEVTANAMVAGVNCSSVAMGAVKTLPANTLTIKVLTDAWWTFSRPARTCTGWCGATMSTNFSTIDLRVERAIQLFDNHDPYPFRERSLDQAAESYIVGKAESMSPRQPLQIVLHLPSQEANSQAAAHLDEAVSAHFRERVDTAQRSLHRLFRDGRRALSIGLAVLAMCLIGGAFADSLPGNRFPKLVAEGLIIFGWVANWRPMEIFLYEWWPIVRQRNIYRRLAAAPVLVRSSD